MSNGGRMSPPLSIPKDREAPISMITAIQKGISQVIRYTEDGVIATILAVMVLFVFTQVIFRYILHLPAPYLEELSRYLMIIFASIGITAVIRQRAHIGVEVLPLIIRSRLTQDIIHLSLNLIWLVAVYLLIYINYGYMMRTWAGHATLEILTFVRMGWIKSFLFIGVVLWAGHFTAIVVKDTMEFMKKYR